MDKTTPQKELEIYSKIIGDAVNKITNDIKDNLRHRYNKCISIMNINICEVIKEFEDSVKGKYNWRYNFVFNILNM